MITSVFWMSLTLVVQVLLINQDKVESVYPVNNYRSRTGVLLGHDLHRLRPLSDVYGFVVIPELSNDDDATAATAAGYNQPSLKRFADITRKRFPIFVGRRSEDADEEMDNWSQYEMEKRGPSRLFVGKRAPPIFVGKKAAFIDLEDLELNKRKKRSTKDQISSTDTSHALVSAHQPISSPMTSLVKQTPSNGSDAKKDTGSDKISNDETEAIKRSRMFVGKREDGELNEEEKRSRMFVGKREKLNEEEKRSRMFVGKREDGELNEEEKRSRMFVGKREDGELNEEEKRSRMFVGKREEEVEQEGVELKRSRMFVGKRPAENEEDIEDMLKMNFPEKKSRMFVGKRTNEEYDDDWNEWSKRSPRFVGKRSPKFVGKRAHKFVGKRLEDEDLLKRSRMFVGKREDGLDSDEEEEEKEEEMDIYNDIDNAKRSRMFVGRRRSNSLETVNKISPKFYFGKRFEENDSERAGSEKRSRMFVEKKSEVDSYDEDDNRSPKFVGKRPFFSDSEALESLQDDEQNMEENSADEIKRSRMFVGKRPAPGFVGKRLAPGFVGKRPAPGFVGKRPAPGFVGKRPAPGFVGK